MKIKAKGRRSLSVNKLVGSILKSLDMGLARDKEAMTKLLLTEFPCDIRLASDPVLPFHKIFDYNAANFRTVTALGLLNCILEPLTGYRIIAVRFSGEPIVQFFELYPYPLPKKPKKKK